MLWALVIPWLAVVATAGWVGLRGYRLSGVAKAAQTEVDRT